MVRGKRKGKHWKKDWHHRVPDFKLVDCTPKSRCRTEKNQFLEVTITKYEGNQKISNK